MYTGTLNHIFSVLQKNHLNQVASIVPELLQFCIITDNNKTYLTKLNSVTFLLLGTIYKLVPNNKKVTECWKLNI